MWIRKGLWDWYCERINYTRGELATLRRENNDLKMQMNGLKTKVAASREGQQRIRQEMAALRRDILRTHVKGGEVTWIIGGNCDYCKARCARQTDEKVPLLYTPEIPFMRQIVCANCMEKFSVHFDKVFESIANSPIDTGRKG